MCWASYGMGLLSLPLLLWLTWTRPWRFLVRLSALLAFLLIGCATQTSDELYELARACGTKQECPKEWNRAHKKEMRETAPEDDRCDDPWVKCMSPEQFDDWLRMQRL